MKFTNLKFFQVIGVLGFGVGIGNAYAGYNNRATAQELVNHVNRMAREQGSEVAENFASNMYRIMFNNNCKNQYFEHLLRNIEQIKQNNELINNYKSVLNSSSLDATTRTSYETAIMLFFNLTFFY